MVFGEQGITDEVGGQKSEVRSRKSEKQVGWILLFGFWTLNFIILIFHLYLLKLHRYLQRRYCFMLAMKHFSYRICFFILRFKISTHIYFGQYANGN
jgi:hypothetical protein